MRKAMIKMIAADLDRTLLHSDGSVSAYTKRVLAQCRAAGMKLVLASARPMRTMKSYVACLEVDGAASCNGAYIWTMEGETHRSIERGAAERFLRRVLDAYPESTISAEIDDTLYANFEIPQWQPTLLPDWTRLPQGEVRKVLLTYAGEAHLAHIRALLEPDMRLSVANGKLIQVQSSAAGKWNALSLLAEGWGIDTSEIACFGDDWDDWEMISRAGWGVAVDNALPEVKEAADTVTASNDQDGVAEALERIGRG